MHAAALHLVPVLAAEKSKTVFYIIAAALVLWALVIAMAVGMRNTNFPGDLGGQRVIIAITGVLVIATATSDVLTSGGSTTPAASAAAPSATHREQSPAPVSPGPTATVPKATTGTPAPPSSPAAGAVSSLELAANPAGQLSYDTKQLTAKAGKVTITMANMSPLEHNVTVAKGATVLGATPTFVGGTRTLTLNLKPGTYTFYCSVPGHRQAGMEGTLTVS